MDFREREDLALIVQEQNIRTFSLQNEFLGAIGFSDSALQQIPFDGAFEDLLWDGYDYSGAVRFFREEIAVFHSGYRPPFPPIHQSGNIGFAS